MTVFVLGCGGGAGPEASSATIPAASPSTGAAPAGQRYAIRMHRDSHVGERGREQIDSQKQETVISRLLGQPPSKSDKITHTRLVGTNVVQEIDEKKDVRRSEITVEEFWQTLNDGPKTVLAPPGSHVTIVRAKTKADAQVTIDGKAASKELREALDDVITVTIGGPSDDDIFGTKEPQAVGAQWLPNVSLAEKDLQDKGMVAKAGGISGKVQLVGTAKVDDVDCIDLQADMSVTGIEQVSDLPAGSVIQTGSVTAHMRGLFPLDEKMARRTDETDVVTKMKVRVPSQQGDVQVDVKAVEHRKGAYTPL